MTNKCECNCEACKRCLYKTQPLKREIQWTEDSIQHWTGYDQWNEKWNVDGRTLRDGVILTKKNGPEIEIVEYFDSIETAKETADIINKKRGNWSAI